ncbi:MAG: zinc-ribbon domain-containing protein [Oscillospiraceae bacterium]|nr:zinc-ribbon domain-containing protein [Oscillospiraceae bacterium]
MLCPECGEVLKDNAVVCKNCGAHIDDEARANSVEEKPSFKSRLVLLAVLAVAVIVAIVLIIALVSANKGQKTAQKLAKGIGEPLDDISEKIDYPLNKQSNYEFLHNLDSAQYVCTSDKEISIEGINAPEWAVFCYTSGEENDLGYVSLYDFTMLDDSFKGACEDSKIDISSVDEGMEYKDFEDIVDIKPYITTYTSGATVYQYRYYYEDVDKNETCVMIWAEFDSDDELVAIKSEETDFSHVIFGDFDILYGNLK